MADLPESLVVAAATAIANAKYPGVPGAPGARPFQPRTYDERYARAATITVLRKLADPGVGGEITITGRQMEEWANQLEANRD